MGTPEFAVPSLRRLWESQTLVGVVTQPDLPRGRGQQPAPSAVKLYARQLGWPVIQPQRLGEPEAMQCLRDWAPDVIVVAAFGQLLKPEVLTLPPHGCVNVHASLLPRHRGAAPIAAAILAGDADSGITLMRMDLGLDTGAVIARRAEPLRPDDTALNLSSRLAAVGAELLRETLPAYLAGQITPQPQDAAAATYAPQLKKSDGHLDFTEPADQVERRVRAMYPWPGAFAHWKGQPLRIQRAAVVAADGGVPGTVLDGNHGPRVVCGTGSLLLLEVQPPGKRPMPAADFVRGAGDFIGARLT